MLTQQSIAICVAAMAVSSLRYRPNQALQEESKFGFVVFSGDAHEYHYWLFRSRLKTTSISVLALDASEEAVRIATEMRREIMRQVVENLRGDALSVAISIGQDALFAVDGEKALEEQKKKIEEAYYRAKGEMEDSIQQVKTNAEDVYQRTKEGVESAAGSVKERVVGE